MEEKVAFIHVSKTGGETIEILTGLPKNHDTALHRKRHEPNFDSKYKFAFVRNPFDRLVSWYFHLRKHMNFSEKKYSDPDKDSIVNQSLCHNILKSGGIMGPDLHRILAVKYDFKNWVKIMLDPLDTRYCVPHWGPLGTQYNMLYGGDKLLVDEVFRFENYEESLKTILTKLNKTELIPKIKKTNFSFHEHYANYYDNDTRELVTKHFKKDLIMFGYTF